MIQTDTDTIDAMSILKKCHTVNVSDSVEELLKHLDRLMMGNVTALVLCAFAVTVCIVAIGYILNLVYTIVETHFRKRSAAKGMGPFKVSGNPDNYTFKSNVKMSESMRESKQSLISGSMQKLRAKYSGYNRALSGYLGTKGALPTMIYMRQSLSRKRTTLCTDRDQFALCHRRSPPSIPVPIPLIMICLGTDGAL
eukprot:gene29472-5819_t